MNDMDELMLTIDGLKERLAREGAIGADDLMRAIVGTARLLKRAAGRIAELERKLEGR